VVGAQLGLWSLRAVVDRAVEMVRQRVALVSRIAAAPEAGRDPGRQVAALTRRPLPTTTPGPERVSASAAVPPAPQESARAPTVPAPPLSSQLPASAPAGGAKEL